MAKQITFLNGTVVSATSNQAEDRFGTTLIRRGILTPEDLERVLEEQTRSNQKFGEILVSLGILDHTSMSEELVAQANANLASLFSWQSGGCVFQPKKIQLPPDHLIWIDVPPLVFRSIKRLGSLLEARMDVKTTIQLPKTAPVLDFALDRYGQALLKHLKSGPMTIRQVQDLLELDEQNALRLAAALELIGQIEIPSLPGVLPLRENMVLYYRSVMRGLFLMLDQGQGSLAIEALQEAWAETPLGQQGVSIELEALYALDMEFKTLGLSLENSLRMVLALLQEKLPVALVENMVQSIEKNTMLHLKRAPELLQWIQEIRLQSPLFSLEPVLLTDLQVMAGQTASGAEAGGLDYETVLLSEIKSRLELRDYTVAKVLCEVILKVKPEHPVAIERQAFSEKLLSNERQIQAALEQARAAELKGRYAEALGHVETAMRFDSARPDFQTIAARLNRLMLTRFQHYHGGLSCKPRLKIPVDQLRYHALTFNESFFISQVDNKTDLQGLALINGLDTASMCRMATSLAERGIIELPEISRMR